MTFFFHQLKNFIQNDPLSDWFSLIHKKYKHFEEDNKSSFEKDIDEKKSKYKEDFFIFLKERQQYHFEFNLDHEQTNELITMKKIGIFIGSPHPLVIFFCAEGGGPPSDFGKC